MVGRAGGGVVQAHFGINEVVQLHQGTLPPTYGPAIPESGQWPWQEPVQLAVDVQQAVAPFAAPPDTPEGVVYIEGEPMILPWPYGLAPQPAAPMMPTLGAVRAPARAPWLAWVAAAAVVGGLWFVSQQGARR